VTRENFVSALGLGFGAFVLSTLYAAAAECPPGQHWTLNLKGHSRCVLNDYEISQCAGRGHQWNYETGRCIKSLKKSAPSTSGGVGGGSADCGPGYSYDPERGCRKIKQIGKSKDQARADCESKGHQWNVQTGRCIKSLKKSNLPADQAPEQTQPSASGGAGG
jgi:nitrite reductase/ring-hydroxylating ferredoxin subunit